MTTVRLVGTEAAPTVLEIVQASFSTRPVLDPPADALGETEESIAAALGRGGGLVASYGDGRDVGALLLDPEGPTLWLRRVGVLPEVREHGFVPTGGVSPYVELRRPAPRVYDAPDAESMRALGAELAESLRAGDVVVLSGELGAGKTTFTQGLGAGLGVRGDVTSPTFVISRIHPSLVDGPPLVHVDAYRLGDVAELDDLDLDTSLDEAVTVVEWGEGIAEGLADDRVEVRIERAVADEALGDDELDPRRVRIAPVGLRWLGVAAPLSPAVG
jgi:tRNA threonylcarbamoyladenosine biosynthesis protein TsaE